MRVNKCVHQTDREHVPKKPKPQVSYKFNAHVPESRPMGLAQFYQKYSKKRSIIVYFFIVLSSIGHDQALRFKVQETENQQYPSP